jgi:hypothetical protein
MAKADIQLTISGGEMAGQYLRFDPGSALQASVQIIPQDAVKHRAIRVAVEWHTEGFGNKDHEDALVTFLAHDGVLQPGTPIYQQLSFTLPTQPWSYAGNLINIIWQVKATIDIPMGKDIEAVQTFILAPREVKSPLELAAR